MMKKEYISKEGKKIKTEDIEDKNEFCTLDIPLDRLKKLLDWEDKKNEPPVKYSIISCDYKGIVKEEDCFFKANIKIETYSDKWNCIPILQNDGIVKESKCKNGGSFGYSQNGYSFMVKGEGVYELEMEFYLPFISKERKNGIKLKSFGSGKFNLFIPKPNLRCTLQPALGVDITDDKKSTNINAFLGAGEINIGWTPKFEEEIKKDLKPIIHGEVSTTISIGEALINCKSTINYSIYQAGVISFDLCIIDAKVMNVTGDGIRNYDINTVKTEEGGQSTIKIFLDYEATNKFCLVIHYEKKMVKPSMLTDIPVIILNNVDRESGYIAVTSKTNVEIKTENINSLTVIDANELPENIRYDISPVFSFKYLKSPYSLKLNVKRHEELPVLICIADKGIYTTSITNEGKIITHINLLVRNNSKQFVNFILPENAVCLSSFVDKNAVKPSKGNNGEIMLPMPKINNYDNKSSFNVELVWFMETIRLKKHGIIELNMGRLDIPISKFGWQIYLPNGFKYNNFIGNVKSVNYLSFSIKVKEEIQSVVQPPLSTNIMTQSMVLEQAEQIKQEPVMFAKSIFKGSLPVKIDIPKTGKINNYEKEFVQNEEIKLKFKYKKKFKLFKKTDEVKQI